MPRKASELNALAVSRLTKPGLHAVGGVSGLSLQVTTTGARTWILRTVIGGKRREMGLGGYPDVPVAEAREKARVVKRSINEYGLDPIEQRKEARSKLKSELAKAITFKQAAAAYITTHEHGWKNAKHTVQWTSTLETYAYPKIGNLLVRNVDDAHVMEILAPIWTTKTETASRLRGRIEKVLDWAIASKYRDGPNPARWKGNLDVRLAAPSKVARVQHHAALPYDDMGNFMKELRKGDGMGAGALEFAILTATRSGEVRGATWQEIDLTKTVWIIPAERIKARKEHHVPLSPAVVDFLKELPKLGDNPYVFPGTKGQLSDMTLTNCRIKAHEP
ncbi:MAG: integrase arm-type DNA-binding domain-containing protein [Methylophilaceae bacterium]